MLQSFQKIPFLKFTSKNSFLFATAKASKAPKDYSKLSYYEILSVNPSATQKEIKSKYYELAKKYHPDTYKGTDTEFFKHVQAAYETLKNPEKRKEYDFKNNNGFQSGTYESSSEPKSSASTSEYKKKSPFADIKVDENMNFDEEYAKFFGKPVETPPDQMVVEEHPFLRQLNREERMRYEYTHLRNNVDLHILKYGHHQGYEETLNDTIQLANRNAQISDEVKQRMHEAEEENMNLKYTIIKAGILIILVPTIMMAYHRRMVAKREAREQVIQFVREHEEYEIQQVQERFVFDDEK